jgi:hypothetical protein
MIADRSVGSRAQANPRGPYRALFGQPVLRGLAVADVCARLPQGMVSITLLLVAAEYASMTVAGLVVAGYTLGQALTAPLRGFSAERESPAGERRAAQEPVPEGAADAGTADDHVAVPHVARHGDQQPDRGGGLAVSALPDVAMAYRDVVEVNGHLWRHDHYHVPVAD